MVPFESVTTTVAPAEVPTPLQSFGSCPVGYTVPAIEKLWQPRHGSPGRMVELFPLFHVVPLPVIEADANVVLQNVGVVMRAARIDGEAVGQGRELGRIVHGGGFHQAGARIDLGWFIRQRISLAVFYRFAEAA